MKEGRHILYDVFIGKTLSLLDAEIEMMKDYFRHHADDTGMKMEVQPHGNKQKVALRWNGTDSDLIELVAALMAAGAVDCTEGKKLTIVDVIRVFEDAFNIKINALYTKRGKVFDRCTDSTPFIDSCEKAISGCWMNGWRKDCTPTTANGRLACLPCCRLADKAFSLRL